MPTHNDSTSQFNLFLNPNNTIERSSIQKCGGLFSDYYSEGHGLLARVPHRYTMHGRGKFFSHLIWLASDLYSTNQPGNIAENLRNLRNKDQGGHFEHHLEYLNFLNVTLMLPGGSLI